MKHVLMEIGSMDYVLEGLSSHKEPANHTIVNFGYNDMEVTRDELIVNMYSDKDNSLYHSEKLNKERQ